MVVQPIACIDWRAGVQALYGKLPQGPSKQDLSAFMRSKYGLGLVGGIALIAFIVWYKRQAPHTDDEPVFRPRSNPGVQPGVVGQNIPTQVAGQAQPSGQRLLQHHAPSVRPRRLDKPHEPEAHGHRKSPLTPETIAQIKDPEDIFHYLNQAYQYKTHKSWLHVYDAYGAQLQFKDFERYLSFISKVQIAGVDQKSLSALPGPEKQKICYALLTEIERLHVIAAQSKSKDIVQALLFRFYELLECHTMMKIKDPSMILDILNLIYARNQSWLGYTSTRGGQMQADDFYWYLAGKIRIMAGVADTRTVLVQAIARPDNKSSVCKALDAEIASLGEIAQGNSDGQKAQNLLSRLRDILGCPTQ